MPADSGEVVDAGVDYITVTATDKKSAVSLLAPAFSFAHAEEKRGSVLKPWGMAGYSGFSCGRVQAGEREDGCIVRLSSTLAQSEWFEVYQRSDNVSRLDLQCTVRLKNNVAEHLDQQLQRALKFSASRKNFLAVTKWRSNDGGYTIYLGKRKSERFARIYDKRAESKEDCWWQCVRYEVELKGASARSVAESIGGAGRAAQRAQSYVGGFLIKRGIELPVPGTDPTSIEVHRIRSDSDRRLEWLARSVRFSVSDLIRRGRLDEVLRALDLSSVVRPV